MKDSAWIKRPVGCGFVGRARRRFRNRADIGFVVGDPPGGLRRVPRGRALVPETAHDQEHDHQKQKHNPTNRYAKHKPMDAQAAVISYLCR
jgi:hypothetical protein